MSSNEPNESGWSGFAPHPEFESYSDQRLQTYQALIDERIACAKQAGDEILVTWYEQEMRALQAERKRRNGAADVSATSKESSGGGNKLELQTWGTFISIDFAETPFTVQELAPDYGLIAVHGRGKDGKTTLLIHACRAIATGQPFLGKSTIRKPVVYLNYEMGFTYLKTLLTAGGPCPAEAYILNRPEPVLQMATIEALMTQVNKPGVLVIDSFRGAFRLQGDSENSAGGAGVVLRSLQDLAVKHKWLIIVIHHRNRSAKEGTDSISGTSDWIAAPDVIWTWARPDKHKPGTLYIEGRMPPVEPIAVQLSPEECVFKGTLEDSQEEIDKTAILDGLTTEGQTAKVIAEAIGRPESTVRRRLEAFYEQRFVNREGEGKRNSPHLYSKLSLPDPENSLRQETKQAQGVTKAALEIFGGRIQPRANY